MIREREKRDLARDRTYCGVALLIFAGDAETADGKRKIALTSDRCAVDCLRCLEAMTAEYGLAK
jgi:hypothetical protein